MIVNLPKLGQVAFPDGLSAKEYDALIGKLEQKYDFRMPKPNIGLSEIAKRGFMRNVGETGIAITDTLPAMLGSKLGFEDYARRQMEEAAQSRAELEEKYPGSRIEDHPIQFQNCLNIASRLIQTVKG